MAACVLIVGLALSIPSANANQEPGWKSNTLEDSIELMIPWAQKFIHATDKEIGWNIPLSDRLLAGQILIEIQKLKQDNKCRSILTPIDPILVAPPIKTQVKQDWTGLGGIGNSE